MQDSYHSKKLDIDEYLDIIPACGQGAIGVECRHDDKEILKMLASLNHEATFLEVSLERYFLKKVGGNCQTPVGCWVGTDEKDPCRFKMRCFLAVSEDEKSFHHEVCGKWDDGFRLVDDFLNP
jgi:porphobilinogen deaminase